MGKKKKTKPKKWSKAKREVRPQTNYNYAVNLSSLKFSISSHIAELACEYCQPAPFHTVAQELFDEHGYPIEPMLLPAENDAEALDNKTMMNLNAPVLQSDSDITAGQPDAKPFRFLDLPPELRVRIYDFAFRRHKQPVCVPDRLLRSSEDFNPAEGVLRECFADVVCLPCQLHNVLGTASSGLSQVCQQLHRETALAPYQVNTFSVHNMYYLQSFLQVIGATARKRLRSLHFVWRLPEHEAKSLDQRTDMMTTFGLLFECTALCRLDMEVDVRNLLAWDEDGDERTYPLHYIYEVPRSEYIYTIRGIKEARITWEDDEGLTGVGEWACHLIGVWRLARTADFGEAVPVKAEMKNVPGTDRMAVTWCAGGDDVVLD